MKLVVTGAAGMLGTDVVTIAEAASHQVVAVSHEDLDLTEEKRVHRLIEREKPATVINCAAWTNVDGAEAEEAAALEINEAGAGHIAAAAARIGAPVVYPSSDYVFPGDKGEPYTEKDETGPLQAYGRTKLAGEKATAAANERAFIVRTSWLFGPEGPNFVETMLRLGAERDEVLVVNDQIGNPTYTGHLATGLVRLIEGTAYGLHHMTGAGHCSWFDFAEEIFHAAGVDCRVMAATTDMVPRPATRPAFSALRSGRDAPITLPDWQRGLREYLKRTGRRATGEEQA